ncbi:ComF family protein [Desulfovibrio sp. OttesenSCG-928-G15]|nr:ComF family protein [Desulfovibrio sp. OttesenSCG-928-G15]
MPSRALESLRQVFAERRCLVCCSVMIATSNAAPLCSACRKGLPGAHTGYCPYCGEAAAWPGLPVAPCTRCLARKPLWSAMIFHGFYEGLLRELILRLKFGGQTLLGHALGSLFCENPAICEARVDLVVPIPLHPVRLRQRGFNQALELARPIAAKTGVPLAANILQRARATAPQAGSSMGERQKNILGAFTCTSAVAGGHILLVDDVFTTGATVEEAVKTLLAAGAARVDLAVLARTALHRVHAQQREK